jgi:hypothetical protein
MAAVTMSTSRAAHSAHRQASNSCHFRVSGSNTCTPKLHAGAGVAKAQSSRIRQEPTAPQRPAGPAVAEATSPRGCQLLPRNAPMAAMESSCVVIV